MFTKLSPQKVQNSEGTIVQVADRFHVEYLYKGFRAIVEVEFGGPTVIIYQSTLKKFDDDSDPTNTKSKEEIISQIVEGLIAMDSKVDLK